MFFWDSDRKLLKSLNDKLVEIGTNQIWIKNNVPDKLHCSKTVWKQRGINVVIVILISGVATYPEQVKTFCKAILKWFGMG